MAQYHQVEWYLVTEESTSGVDNTIGTIVTKQEPIMITGRNGSNSIEWSNVMLMAKNLYIFHIEMIVKLYEYMPWH